MQNRKLQGEDIEKLKNEQKTTSSTTAEISSGESVMGPGSYSRRPLVPSASGTVRTDLNALHSHLLGLFQRFPFIRREFYLWFLLSNYVFLDSHVFAVKQEQRTFLKTTLRYI